MEAQLLDFCNEVHEFGIVPEEGVAACDEMVAQQKRLYQDVAAWRTWQPDSFEMIKGTWLEELIEEVLSDGPRAAQEFFVNRSDEENYGHPLKTEARMELVVSVSGLARVLFTSLVRFPWIHVAYKALLFALAASEREAEYPHEMAFSLPTEEGMRTISLFVHD